MTSKTSHIMKISRWMGAIVIAGVLTTFWQQANVYQGRKSQFENAYQWARQISSQAEGLFLDARQRGEVDPVGWVITHLSQGTEPRIMKILRLDPEVDQIDFQYRADKKIYESAKLLGSDGSSGIKVQIDAPSIRYLGVQNSFLSDFLVGVTFLLCLSFFLWITSPLVQEKVSEAEPQINTQPMNTSLVERWIKEARALLSTLGGRIRDLISEARNLTKVAAESKTAISRLRTQLHQQLQRIRDSRDSVRQLDKLTHQSEALTLNLVIEAAKLTREAPDAARQNIVRMCEEVHVLLTKMRALNVKSEKLARQAEIEIEPLVADSDMAFNAFEDIFRAASRMDAHIKSTTEALIGHAQLLQRLGKVATQAQSEPTSENEPTLSLADTNGRATSDEPVYTRDDSDEFDEAEEQAS